MYLLAVGANLRVRPGLIIAFFVLVKYKKGQTHRLVKYKKGQTHRLAPTSHVFLLVPKFYLGMPYALYQTSQLYDDAERR